MMRVMAASIALCAVCARADMASLVVPAGDEMTISASATYDTVTVNGTLIVSAGTLTATNAFRIADGAGATGTLVITNSGKILSSEGTLAVGVNGGSGTVRVHATGNVCRFVEIGDGGGASVLRYAGGQIQSRNIRKKGSGTCRLEFAGGGHSFSMQQWFLLDDGQLTLASVDGAPAEVENINGGLTGIRLGEGTHHVEMRYSVPRFKPGLIISVIAAALYLCAWIYVLRVSRRAEKRRG